MAVANIRSSDPGGDPYFNARFTRSNVEIELEDMLYI